MSRKIVYTVIAVLAVIGLVYAGTTVLQQNQQAAQQNIVASPTPTAVTQGSQSTSTAKGVTYQGQDGKTALAVLQEKYPDTKVSGEGANAFVTAINGYAASDAKHEFWKLIINGEDAQVGAGSYVTKSSDTIKWEIDTY